MFFLCIFVTSRIQDIVSIHLCRPPTRPWRSQPSTPWRPRRPRSSPFHWLHTTWPSIARCARPAGFGFPRLSTAAIAFVEPIGTSPCPVDSTCAWTPTTSRRSPRWRPWSPWRTRRPWSPWRTFRPWRTRRPWRPWRPWRTISEWPSILAGPRFFEVASDSAWKRAEITVQLYIGHILALHEVPNQNCSSKYWYSILFTPTFSEHLGQLDQLVYPLNYCNLLPWSSSSVQDLFGHIWHCSVCWPSMALQLSLLAIYGNAFHF